MVMKNLFNLVGVLIVVLIVFVTSCKEDLDPTVVEIQVVTDSGEVVPFADVLLSCTSSVNLPCDIEIDGTTDANGKYTREFDLPQVLQVTVGKLVNDTDYTLGGIVVTQDTICGNSFVSIKPEETSRATIILYDCN